MTLIGVTELVTRLIKTYPGTYGTYGRQDTEELIETWAMALEDYEDESVMKAFKAFLVSDQKGFPPSVGQLVARIPSKENLYGKVLTPGEAWVLVLDAMKNVTYQPRESFDGLPEMIQQIIGGVEVLRELGSSNEKSREIEKQRFLKEYAAAVAEAKAAGRELPERGYRDEKVGGDFAPRPEVIRCEDYYFPGAIEVGNPTTQTIKYVQYKGYPYGDGNWTEHGGLTDKQLEEWHMKMNRSKKPKGKHAEVATDPAESEEVDDGNECKEPTGTLQGSPVDNGTESVQRDDSGVL